MSNVLDAETGEPIGALGSGEAAWHTDMSYLELPPKASMLHAIEVPPTGGDTSFACMYAAYESLPPSLKRKVSGLRVKHDGTYNSGGLARAGVDVTDDPRLSPGFLHPLVVQHPQTGRECLYLGRRLMAWVEGLDLESSALLLDELWEHATAPELVWTQKWRVGDLVFWDNRSTLHRRDPFPKETRRVMHRTQIKGEEAPVAPRRAVAALASAAATTGAGSLAGRWSSGRGTTGGARAASAHAPVAVARPRTPAPILVRRCCLVR